ncbi:hypothetical protein [Stutzerimonas nosocomialis]|uniref:hypothetical protein n=1 Tax=Stutzerimonas nosocomialis TaxID=1056496 RepID=UPI00110931CE|nr:hypothetical protein [Stutzerimonas nosocomialis]
MPHEIGKMRRAKAAIVGRTADQSLASVISSDRGAFSGIRMLWSSETAGVPMQALGRSENPNVPLGSLFSGNGIQAFSDDIEQQMKQSNAVLEFAYFTLLDTNFLSELPRFFRGERNDHTEKVGDTLQFIDTQPGRGIDWTFASLENLREVVKSNNPWPYQKVAAAKLFDSMKDFQQVRSGRMVVAIEDHIPAAEKMWETFITSPHMWAAVKRRDVMYCVILRAILDCWSGFSVDVGVSRLVDFCLDRFGFMPLKELYFGWKALSGLTKAGPTLPIFDEPALQSPNGDSINRISALAWDLFMFRWCETLMTEMKGNRFVIPAITTLDAGLLAAIQSCPLKAILIHDEAGLVEAIFEDERDFGECLQRAMSSETLARINDPVRRAKKKDVSRHELSLLIYNLELEAKKARNSR